MDGEGLPVGRHALRIADRAYALQTGRTIRAGASRDLLDDSFVRTAPLKP